VDVDVIGEGELANLDLLVSLLDFGRLKWRSAAQHCVKDDTDGPVVYLVAVTVSIFKHFRG
jgi:hypothetical protein